MMERRKKAEMTGGRRKGADFIAECELCSGESPPVVITATNVEFAGAGFCPI